MKEMTPVNEIADRMRQIESENKRLKVIIGLVALLAAVGAVDTIRQVTMRQRPTSNELILKDSSGIVVAKIDEKQGTSCLEISGKRHIASAELCAGDEYGASFYLTNSQGKNRVFLTAGSKMFEGGTDAMVPSLIIAADDGKRLISATVGLQTDLVVGHGTQQDSIVLSSNENSTFVKVSDHNGKPSWTTPVADPKRGRKLE